MKEAQGTGGGGGAAAAQALRRLAMAAVELRPSTH